MASCGFSSGFSSGFCAVAEEEPAVLRGVPVLPRFRRLRPVELEAFGLIAIVGTGELTTYTVVPLSGLGPLVLEGSGELAILRMIAAAAAVDVIGDGQATADVGVGATSALVFDSATELQQGTALAGAGELEVDSTSAISAGSALVATIILVEPEADAAVEIETPLPVTVSTTHELMAAVLLREPVGVGEIVSHISLAGTIPLVTLGQADLYADDERTAVMLLLSVP